MKYSILAYMVVGIGVSILAVGLYYLSLGNHPFRAYGAIGLGAVVAVVGIVATFFPRSNVPVDSN